MFRCARSSAELSCEQAGIVQEDQRKIRCCQANTVTKMNETGRSILVLQTRHGALTLSVSSSLSCLDRRSESEKGACCTRPVLFSTNNIFHDGFHFWLGSEADGGVFCYTIVLMPCVCICMRACSWGIGARQAKMLFLVTKKCCEELLETASDAVRHQNVLEFCFSFGLF